MGDRAFEERFSSLIQEKRIDHVRLVNACSQEKFDVIPQLPDRVGFFKYEYGPSAQYLRWTTQPRDDNCDLSTERALHRRVLYVEAVRKEYERQKGTQCARLS